MIKHQQKQPKKCTNMHLNWNQTIGNIFQVISISFPKLIDLIWVFDFNFVFFFVQILAVIPAGVNITHMSTQIKAAVDEEQNKVLWVPMSNP